MRSRTCSLFATLVVAVVGFVGTSHTSGAQDQIVLRYGTLDAPDSIIGKAQDWYLTRVEELSGGRVKFERYWSESLVPARELLDALTTGISDVSFLIPGYFPSKLPLLTVATVPTTHSDAYTFGMALHDLVLETPAVSDELASWGAVYLTSSPFPPFNILSKAPIDSVSDLKGLKIRTFGGMATLVSRLGAVSVSIPTPEVYTALQRGTVDAATYPPFLVVDFKFYETAKYLWDQPIGTNTSILAMRKARWDALPDDLKEIFRTAAVEHQAAYHRIVQVEGNEIASKVLADAGVQITPGTEEADTRINEEIEPMWADWIAEMEGNGLPGQVVADKFRALLDEYSKSVPH
jgi:TRAP-type C4-dicarboxylate transport system substrate-binding protein